jgi:hypothetical protein
MDPSFDVASLPYSPGNSPYRIRGVGYLGTFVHCKEALPGGVAQVKARLPATLREFFEQRFKAKTFYDVYPFAIFMRELAALRGMTPRDLLTSLGATRAANDVDGVLKFVLKMISPSTLSTHLAVLSTQWWGFLQLAQTEATSTGVTIAASGIPAPLRNFVPYLGVAYHVEALRLSGTPSAQSEFRDDFHVTKGTGVASEGTLTYRVSW